MSCLPRLARTRLPDTVTVSGAVTLSVEMLHVRELQILAGHLGEHW
jgi:hypothetical protein